MKNKMSFFVILILLLLAFAGTGCDALSNLTGDDSQNEQVSETGDPTRVPPAGTELEPPPRMPPIAPISNVSQPTEVPVVTSSGSTSTGNVEPCKLPARVTNDPYQYQLLGIPRSSGFVPSTGTVEVAVLFVDYSDARATTSPEQALGLISPFALSQYFSDVSYGQMELEFKPYSNWLNLPQPASYYREILFTENRKEEDEINFVQEAVNLADPNVDFSNTDAIILIGNPQAADDLEGLFIFSSAQDSLGIQADGNTIRSSIIVGSYLVNPNNAESLRNNSFARIIGTIMSLQYLRYSSDVSEDVTVRASSVGQFSIMGWNLDTQHAPGMFAFERWQLGWLEDGQIVCQTGGEQTTDLSAIENSGGTKAVMVPLGEQKALVVESRRAIGTDARLVKVGALVYTVDTSLGLNEAPIRVLPMNDNDLNREQAPLAQGEFITHCGITITNMAAGGSGDTVRVTIPAVIQCEGEPAVQASTPAPTPTALPPKIGACSLGNIPAPTQTDVVVRFTNESGFQAIGFWENKTQSSIEYVEFFQVATGFSFDQEAKKNHKWIVQEPAGATLMEYTVSEDEKQCVLIKRPLGTLWVDFVNESGVPAIGYLVGAGGVEEYFRVGVGATTGLWTGNGVAWRILDGNGNVLLEYTSTVAAEQRVVIPPQAVTPTPELVQATAVPQTTEVPQATQAPAATNTPVSAPTTPPLPSAADMCVNIDSPPNPDQVMIRLINLTGSPITVSWLNPDGSLDQGLTFAVDPTAKPEDAAFYYGKPGTFEVAILGANNQIVNTYTPTNEKLQCVSLSPTAPPVQVPLGVPVPTVEPPQAVTCANVPNPTSSGIMLRFINKRNAPVDLYYEFITTGGPAPAYFYTIGPGEFLDQGTDQWINWIIKDAASGNVLMEYPLQNPGPATQCLEIP